MSTLDALIRKACAHVAKDKAYRAIPPQGDIYLMRYYLAPPGDPVFEADGVTRKRNPGSPDLALHLHHFRRSDADQELHNHPWEWAVALILTGGYWEERRELYVNGTTRYRVVRKLIKPWRPWRPWTGINFIRANDFHRVDLCDTQHGAWTLLLAGPRMQDWGFWCRTTGVFTHWEKFVTKKSKRGYEAPPLHQLGGLLVGIGSVFMGKIPENWIPDDHAAEDAPWNGDEEAFEKPEKKETE